jgi:DNA invertase Pin-like site-specific DNA recombinase
VLVTEAKRVAIYARVSTTDQDPENQLHELRDYIERTGATLVETYIDHGVSGAKDRRPELDRLMADARRRRFQAVVVWKFDRFARSVRHLVTALEEFAALGIDFVSTTEAIDTATPLGRAMFTIAGAFAQLERDMIRERVRAGLAKARAKGVKLGRRPKVFDVTQARARIEAGESRRSVARDLGVSHATIGRALAAVSS